MRKYDWSIKIKRGIEITREANAQSDEIFLGREYFSLQKSLKPTIFKFEILEHVLESKLTVRQSNFVFIQTKNKYFFRIS